MEIVCYQSRSPLLYGLGLHFTQQRTTRGIAIVIDVFVRDTPHTRAAIREARKILKSSKVNFYEFIFRIEFIGSSEKQIHNDVGTQVNVKLVGFYSKLNTRLRRRSTAAISARSPQIDGL